MIGDGPDGLAFGIVVAIAAMIIVMTGLFFVLARLLGGAQKSTLRRRRSLTAGMSVFGAATGLLLVIATFAEDVWSPPLETYEFTACPGDATPRSSA